MSDSAKTLLDAVGTVTNMLASARSNTLIKYTESARVEPIVTIATSLRELPYTPDLLKQLTSIFAGYYLQAVAISTNVGKVDTLRLLDKLNTRRSPLASAAGSIDRHIATEMYKDGFVNYTPVALEAREEKYSSGFGKGTVEKAYDDANLTTGKLLEVHISDGDKEATIPVAVRLMVRSMSNQGLVDVLSLEGKDRTVKERIHQWREGDLKFWRDLVWCQDIIDDRRRMLKADSKSGFKEAAKNRQKNRLAGMLSLDPSVNNISSIAIIDSNMAKAIERTARMKMSRSSDRNALMDRSLIMLLVVVDTDYEVVTIYHNGLDTYTELSAKELKAASKGKESDVGDILKSYLDSRAPSF